jgi:hypothetical protein
MIGVKTRIGQDRPVATAAAVVTLTLLRLSGDQLMWACRDYQHAEACPGGQRCRKDPRAGSAAFTSSLRLTTICARLCIGITNSRSNFFSSDTLQRTELRRSRHEGDARETGALRHRQQLHIYRLGQSARFSLSDAADCSCGAGGGGLLKAERDRNGWLHTSMAPPRVRNYIRGNTLEAITWRERPLWGDCVEKVGGRSITTRFGYYYCAI